MHLIGRIELGTGLFTSAGPKPRNEDCLGIHIPDASLLPTKGIVACIADGVSATTRSDLFSITLISYHLVTGGHHPYGKAWNGARSPQDFHHLAYHPAAALNSIPWLPSGWTRCCARHWRSAAMIAMR